MDCHTTITHSYVVDHQDFPECNNCNKLLTVKHILTELQLWSLIVHINTVLTVTLMNSLDICLAKMLCILSLV